jgi:carbonic anhydrase
MNYLKDPVEKARSEPGDIVANATRQNVVANVQKLQTSEPILAGLVKEGRLAVVGGIYDLATGEVEILA